MDSTSDEWLTSLKDKILNEEYIRLNYHIIIESMVEKLNSIDLKNDTKLLNNLLEILLKTLEYNRRHPSPQRSIGNDIIVGKCIEKLLISCEYTAEQLLNQNLLIKVIKYIIKDSNYDNYSNELVIKITEKFLNYLKTIKSLLNNQLNNCLITSFSELVLNTIRCIYLLINNFKYDLIALDLNQFCGQLLGVLKLYSFYGIPGYDISRIGFTDIYPSHLSQYMPIDNSLKDKKSRKPPISRKSRKSMLKNNNLIEKQDIEDDNDFFNTNMNSVKTSDSEFSSSDYESIPTFDDKRIQRSTANKIRLISYESLSTAINLFDKRVIFGFWSSFIPDSSGPLIPFTTLSSIIRDPSARVRSSALTFLYRLLLSGDQFVMTLADETSHKSLKQLSFTPLSQSLASMVSEIHNGFALILFGETNTSVLIHVFKCLSLLITISPYNKLKPGLFTDIFHKSMFMLSHKDIQIQNSSLALYVKVFELDQIPEELKTWITTSDGINSINKLINFSSECILSSQSIILFGESLKLLTTILKQKSIIDLMLNSPEIKFNLDLVMNIAIKCVENDVSVSNQVIQNLLCKYLFSIGSVLKYRLNNVEEEVVLRHKNWWITLLNCNLVKDCLESNNQLIAKSSQTLIIDFLSTISEEVFETLEKQKKFLLISILLSIARSYDSNIDDINPQSSAIRCLGVYQSFPSMTEDFNYLFDVSMISIEVMNIFCLNYNSDKKPTNYLLLYQSSWTLANTTDILKKFYINSSEIDVNLMFNIIDCVLKSFELNITGMQFENIRTNFVRIIGCVLYNILMNNEIQSTIDLKSKESNYLNKILISIQKLVNCMTDSKSFKLHWNVCNVFTYLLSVELFIDLCKTNYCLEKTDYLLIDCIFDTIINLMKNSRNHKVQSYAIHSICSQNYFHFNEQSLNDFLLLIINILIDNYFTVPLNIRQNWFEKFCLSIDKSLKYYEQNFDTKQILALIKKLNEFCFDINAEQENSEIFKKLTNTIELQYGPVLKNSK